MEQDIPVPGPRIGRLTIGTGMAVVVLLALRYFIGSFPMIKNAPAISGPLIGDSLLSPLVICNAITDTAILILILSFGFQLGNKIQNHGEPYAGLGKIVTRATLAVVFLFAYKTYELLAACIFVGRADLVNLHTSIAQSKGAYPDFMAIWASMIDQLNATAIQNASGDALIAYQQIALAMFRRPPDYYAWAFLVLIAIPVIGLVALVLRNLGTMAELLSRGTLTPQQTRAHAPTSGAAPVAPTSASRPKPPAPSQPGGNVSLRQMAEKIAKIKMLRDSGAISTADFDTQKQRILGLAIDPSSAVHGSDDFMKLKSLLETGALSEEEYEAQKQRFLQHI